MRTPHCLPAVFLWRLRGDQRGFTLIEVMIAIVLMTVGLVAAAGSFPALTQAALYGKDQTRAANLAQQQVEDYRNTVTTTLSSAVGDFGTVASQYFDQNGVTTTQGAAYFTRDVQIQYWTWSVTSTSFVQPASPYVSPTTSYVYHISVVTHWPVRGHTAFVSGTTPEGCVVGGAAAAVGLGCITLSSFTSP
jgi:prepilin-type N-terminal cleavage/methylation domain-containing protein